MDRLQRNYDHALKIAFIFLLGSLVYYRKLGTYRLQSWDEAWYAIQGKYALVHGQWVATQTFLQGSSTIGPQFKMPPLHAWLQALSFSVFGFTEFAARLPSATATILLACVIYWIGTREFSSRVGWIGAICWLILPALWGVSGGRQAIEDVIFSLVGVLYVYAAYRVVSDDDPRWLTLAGVFAGLSLLTKGLNAGIFVIVLLPLVIWRWRFFINTVHTTACVALTAILGASWPLYMYSEFGDRFIQVFIVSQVLNRATGGARGDPTFAFMNFPYLKRLPTYMDPVIWFLIPACIYAIYHFWNTPDKWKIVFLNWWLFSVLVFFIVTGTHAPYIIPAYVAGVVLVGILLSQTTRGETHAQIASVSGLLLTLTLSPRFGVSPLQLARRGMWNRDPTSDQLRFIGFILAIGGILLWPYISEALQSEFRIGRNVKKFVPVLIAVIIALSLAAPATFPAANTQYSTGMWVQDNVDPNEPVSVVRGSPAIHAFIFYSDRRVSPVKLNNVNNSCDCSVLVGPQSLSDNYGSQATLPVHTFGSEWTLLDLKGQKSTNRLRE